MSVDPIRLEIFKNLFHSVAEEMGAALRRSAFSANIKERRDYSCAVFDAAGDVLAMGDHMPVHLGSMPMSVQAALRAFKLGPGDVALLNDPYAGGTHLPDLTMVMPVFAPRSSRPLFYIANRAHHADIGGAHAGSMGLSREIFEEGLRIPPVKIMEKGRLSRDVDGDSSGQRAHPARTRRRSDRPDRRVPHRRAPLDGARREIREQGSDRLRTPLARLLGQDDGRNDRSDSRWRLPRRRFSG